METYASFSRLGTNELQVVRYGFFRPTYELTDGAFTYAALKYSGMYSTCFLTTTDASWTVKRQGIFSRVMLIMDGNGNTIGTMKPETWSRKTSLVMDNSFEASFLYKKILSGTATWVSPLYGDMVNIETKLWGIKKVFTVTFDMNLLQQVPMMPLLILLGVNLALLQQSQAAAS